MPKKQTIISDVASTLGAAAARVEKTLAPKRSTMAKHKAKPPALETKAEEIASNGITDSVAAEVGVGEIERGEIARLAYLYWEARGGENGSEEQDWLRAEKDLKHRTLTASV